MATRLATGFREWLEARKHAVSEDKKLSKEAVVSLFIHFCFQFGASMSSVFLTLYLWRLTHSLWINGMYYVVTYAATPLAFALGGWLIKRKDRMFTYRFGIALIALFYLVVVFAQERVVDYYVLFAVFGGLASSFYWVGYLTLMYDVSTEQNRIRYLATNMIIFTLAGLIGPALAGFIIRQNDGLRGYTFVFSVAFFMFLLATIGSFKIKSKLSHHKAYYLKFTGLLMRKNKIWTGSLFGFSVLGMLQGIMLFLPTILLFQIVGREDLVGYLGVMYASVSIGTGLFISKYGREDLAKLFLLISTVGFIAGTLLIVWSLSLLTVILFMIIYSICAPLQGNTMTTHYFRLISMMPLKGQLRVESVVVREIFVNCGRVIAILILIGLSRYVGEETLPWVVFGAAIVQINLVWLLRSNEAKEAKEPKKLAAPGKKLNM
ncbi:MULTISPECIES: MFS transporter [unclassified Paenibacillus]|uniref:MFS transporter n=1 Tax=unclassified Paenibacillus TaxID=185978 RepID=UPI0036283932